MDSRSVDLTLEPKSGTLLEVPIRPYVPSQQRLLNNLILRQFGFSDLLEIC